MRARVHSVDNVQLKIFRSKPAQIVVIAMGKTVTTGWWAAKLTPVTYVAVPRDGILDIDFTARAPLPGTLVLPVLTPIAAALSMPVPNWVKGVRVHAATNSMDAGRNTESVEVEEKVRAENAVPWPWASGPAAQ